LICRGWMREGWQALTATGRAVGTELDCKRSVRTAKTWGEILGCLIRWGGVEAQWGKEIGIYGGRVCAELLLRFGRGSRRSFESAECSSNHESGDVLREGGGIEFLFSLLGS